MKTKIDMADIQLTQLNSACLVWVSKFTRALQAHNGTVIHMQDKNVIGQIIQQTHKANNPDLDYLYRSLKNEIRALINSEKFDQRSLASLVITTEQQEKLSKPARR